MKKKIFISHASEDKEAFVRPFAEALKTDFDVWYDEYQLVVGMSLLEEINKGLAACDYGIVVLSKRFFEKQWPQNELNGLFSLEEKDKKVILPVWHGIEKSEVMKYSPILADRYAVKSNTGIVHVKDEIKRSISYFEQGKVAVEISNAGSIKLKNALRLKAEKERSNRIVNSDRGVFIAGNFGQDTINLLTTYANKLIEEGATGISIDGPNVRKASYANNSVDNCNVKIWVYPFCLHAIYSNRVCNSARDARLKMILRDSVENDAEGEEYNEIEQEKYSIFIGENDNCLWVPEYDKLPFTSQELVNNWMERLSDHLLG